MPHEFRFGRTYCIEWELPTGNIRRHLEHRGSEFINIGGDWDMAHLFLDRTKLESWLIRGRRIKNMKEMREVARGTKQ